MIERIFEEREIVRKEEHVPYRNENERNSYVKVHHSKGEKVKSL